MGGTRHLVCGELTTGFIVSLSFSLFLASTCFLSSFIPLWLPPCLWRFAIKTAVTQSKTVKPELRPHSPACLLCPVFFFFFFFVPWIFLGEQEGKMDPWKSLKCKVMLHAQFQRVTFCRTKVENEDTRVTWTIHSLFFICSQLHSLSEYSHQMPCCSSRAA